MRTKARQATWSSTDSKNSTATGTRLQVVRRASALTWHPIEARRLRSTTGTSTTFRLRRTESYTLSAGFAVHNCDFFKNNAYFAHTTRKMMDEIANHAARIRRYVERFGEDEVEAFMDKCMSIDDLIDIHSVAIKRRDDLSRYDFTPSTRRRRGAAGRRGSRQGLHGRLHQPARGA